MFLAAGPWRQHKAEGQAQADRQAEITHRRGAGHRQQAKGQPGGDGCQQRPQQADSGTADLFAHEDCIIDADRRHQQQAEQAEQGQRLPQPTEAGQATQRRQQRQGDNPQRAAQAKGQDQQQDDQYTGQ